MNKFRKYFPIFKKQKEIIYFDNAGTTLKHKNVIFAINQYYKKYSINDHTQGSDKISKKVRKEIEETRKIISKEINAESEEIFFLPSATYSLNILSFSLENILKKNDKILLTFLEHSSNIFPWQSIAKKKKAKIEFLKLNENFIIDLEILKKKIDKNVKIVSFFHVSNSFGSTNPVEKITKIIKKNNPKCIIILDACQSISYYKINVKKMKIDALVFSAHKIYGPTGIGVLWIKKKINEITNDVLWGGGKKTNPLNIKKTSNFSDKKFEVGTLPLAQIFGLKKSFEFINNLKKNKRLILIKNYALKKLSNLKNIIIYNKNSFNNKNIIIFNIKRIHSHDITDYLGKKGIIVRSGNFCCPYLKNFIKKESAIRLSFSIYNNKKEFNKFFFIMKKIINNSQILIE